MQVKVKVVSERGHDEKLLLVDEALEEIRMQTQEHGKWLYIDGEQKNSDVITDEDIRNAMDITLTDALAGG